MKQIVNYKTKVAKRFIVLLLIIVLLFESTVPAFAQVNTPTMAPEPSSEQQAVQNLPNPAALESLESSPSPSPSFIDPSSASSAVPSKPTLIRRLAKMSFRSNERVNVVVDNITSGDLEVKVFDANNNEVEFERFTIDDGTRKTAVIKPPTHFAPGKYKVKITAGGKTYEQDFTWGVLAVNTNKSIYIPLETAKLAIGVLDEYGEMVCDALVTLEITNPNLETQTLSTVDGSIKVNDSCTKKEVTITPDYESTYLIGSELGVYDMKLTADTENGTYSIDDSFEVRESVPFDVERTTATRIFPPLAYPVDLDIIANQDFTGTVVDLVPGNFVISQSSTSDFTFSEQKNFSSQAVESGVLGASSSAVLGLPFEGEVPINQEFGEHLRDPLERDIYSRFNLAGHDGVDFDTPSGTNIIASDDGKVVLAGAGAYGVTVVLEHSWGRSYYGHLSSIKVKLNQDVKRGELIALSGNTGLSTGPHLHFGVKLNSNDMQNGYYGKTDPLPLLGLPSTLDPDNQVKLIYWNISVKKGEKFRLSYFYKAPKISPEFYKIGPLRFYENGANVFEEARQWQIAVDADGSGTNTVSPSSGATSALDQTYTFTFTAGETMDSGGAKITAPVGWNAPQGSVGTAGYTTVTGGGNATVGTVLSAVDTATGWVEFGGTDACDTGPVADATIKQEGTNSVSCISTTTGPDGGDGIAINFTTQNWSAYTDFSFWARSDDGMTTADIDFGTNNEPGTTNSCTTMIQSGDFPSALTADTWVYQKVSLSGTRTDVEAVCFLWVGNSFDNDTVWIDEMMVGPGVPTFSGQDVNFRILDAANGESFSIVYGSGGGTSGVDNPASAGVHTFTTQSRPLVTGTLTNLSAGSPTVTLCAGGCGPTLDQLLKHGKWFSGGVEQPFTF